MVRLRFGTLFAVLTLPLAVLAAGLVFLPAASVRAEDSPGMEEVASPVMELTANLKGMSPEAMSSKANEIAEALAKEATAKSATVRAARAAITQRSAKKRKVYHITYVKGVGWKVKAVGAKRASYIIRSKDKDLVVTSEGTQFAKPGPGSAAVMFRCGMRGISESKECAIAIAKELAKKAKLGQVVIHKKNGRIQTEYTYGGDPFPPKG